MKFFKRGAKKTEGAQTPVDVDSVTKDKISDPSPSEAKTMRCGWIRKTPKNNGSNTKKQDRKSAREARQKKIAEYNAKKNKQPSPMLDEAGNNNKDDIRPSSPEQAPVPNHSNSLRSPESTTDAASDTEGEDNNHNKDNASPPTNDSAIQTSQSNKSYHSTRSGNRQTADGEDVPADAAEDGETQHNPGVAPAASSSLLSEYVSVISPPGHLIKQRTASPTGNEEEEFEDGSTSGGDESKQPKQAEEDVAPTTSLLCGCF